jgi:hypothetical protein
MTDSAFAEYVLRQVPPAAPSYPQVNYDPDGDCIEFLLSQESYHGRRIDCLTTVYFGQESGDIVGSLIKGVRNFIADVLRHTPGFRVDILDGRIRLQHIFTAKLWSEKDVIAAEEVHIYRFLRDKAEEMKVEVEFSRALPHSHTQEAAAN